MLPLKPPVPANAATKGAAFKDRKLKQLAVNKDFRVVKPAQKAEASKAAQKTAEQGVERTIVANHQQPTVQPMEEVEHTGPSGRPPGYRTPSPPHNAVEPISPVQADPRPYQPQKQRQNQLPTQIPDHTPYQRQQPHREQQGSSQQHPLRITEVIEPGQTRLPKPPKIDAATKETVPINMAKNKDRFTVEGFLGSEVTLPIWQLLDRSPQIRAQLARAMASCKPTKRGKRPAASAAVVGPPKVATEAHEDEDVTCLYLEA